MTTIDDSASTPEKPAPWWRSAAIYQVYPRSFADSDGNGVGDLEGVRSRLDYLKELGIDAIWLSPFYKSPQVDGGYDVEDYRQVDPLFGDLSTFDALLEQAHARGLKIIIDLVPNHTSEEHVWFKAALAAKPGSPERARYWFRDGTGPNGDLPPNNWVCGFGGSAWERVPDGQWYLHIFSKEQPDLDWTNPEVREEFLSILRFWCDRGVDGFRIDVAHGLAKDPEMRDLTPEELNRKPFGRRKYGHPYWDQPAVHNVYRGWRELLDMYPGDRATIAEAWVENPNRLAAYLRSDELNTAFNFDYLKAHWGAPEMREVIDGTMEAMDDVGAPATWVLSNHDVVRHLTRYGGGEVGLRRARSALLLTLSLPGGAYIYQGEELGLEEVEDIPANRRQDPVFFMSEGKRPGRDGCRVPLPWSGTSEPFGFGPEGSEPWLPQPEEWSAKTVEAQSGQSDSTLNYYRRALQLRHELPALGDGSMEWITTEDGILAFTREPGFACVINFSDVEAPIPAVLGDCEVLLSSEPSNPGHIAADSGVWLRRK